MNNKKQIYMLMKEASYEYKTGSAIYKVLEIENDIISSLCVGEDPVFDYDEKI